MMSQNTFSLCTRNYHPNQNHPSQGPAISAAKPVAPTCIFSFTSSCVSLPISVSPLNTTQHRAKSPHHHTVHHTRRHHNLRRHRTSLNVNNRHQLPLVSPHRTVARPPPPPPSAVGSSARTTLGWRPTLADDGWEPPGT